MGSYKSILGLNSYGSRSKILGPMMDPTPNKIWDLESRIGVYPCLYVYMLNLRKRLNGPKWTQLQIKSEILNLEFRTGGGHSELNIL